MTKQLTVAELITELQKMPQDALVSSEGCDCWGEVDRVELRPKEDGNFAHDQFVLIGRIDGVES